jgi:hypothetical protein
MELPTAIVVCAGPSALTVGDWFSPGYPVVAVSTALRLFESRPPDYWVTVDPPNRNHHPEFRDIIHDHRVAKIMIARDRQRIPPENVDNCHWFRHGRQKDVDSDVGLFDGEQPFLRSANKSILFCIQWLYHVGCRGMIITGCDLNPDLGYAYQDTDESPNDRNLRQTVPRISKILRRWAPLAEAAGFEWKVWGPSRMTGFCPPWHSTSTAGS